MAEMGENKTRKTGYSMAQKRFYGTIHVYIRYTRIKRRFDRKYILR